MGWILIQVSIESSVTICIFQSTAVKELDKMTQKEKHHGLVYKALG